MWAYFEQRRLYSSVWVEPINSMLVVKGFTFVGESLYSFYSNLCRYEVSCAVVPGT